MSQSNNINVIFLSKIFEKLEEPHVRKQNIEQTRHFALHSNLFVLLFALEVTSDVGIQLLEMLCRYRRAHPMQST